MDAGQVLVAILLIGCAGWIVWARVTSNRRARESGSPVADSVGTDGGPQLAGPPDPGRDVPPEGSAPTGARASAPSRGRTAPRAGRRTP